MFHAIFCILFSYKHDSIELFTDFAIYKSQYYELNIYIISNISKCKYD